MAILFQRRMAQSSVRFAAAVKKAGVNPYVDLPATMTERFADRRTRSVLVRVAPAGRGGTRGRTIANPERLRRIGRLTRDGWFRTTVVPARGQPYGLHLDMWMRRSAGVAVGDSVRVTLRHDSEPRELPVPPTLCDALSQDPAAKRAWEDWSPSRRKQALSYLNFLGTGAARVRTVSKRLVELRGK